MTEIAIDNVAIMKMRWVQRRYMTWTCLASYIALTAWLMIFAPPAAINALMIPYTAFTTFVGGLIGAYFGLATVDDVKNRDAYTTTPAEAQ